MTAHSSPHKHLKKTDDSPWFSRGYIPHFNQSNVTQSITFRLSDSLPRNVVLRIEKEIEDSPVEKRSAEQRKRCEYYLGQGLGSCVLGNDLAAQIVSDALHYFDGERYRLLSWVLMPNHVHVMIECTEDFPLSKILHGWKSFTANSIRKLGLDVDSPREASSLRSLSAGGPKTISSSDSDEMRGSDDVKSRRGLRRSQGQAFWQRDYWDRYIRDEQHFLIAKDYIENNPVQAKLCAHAEDWRWSSASKLMKEAP